MALVNFTNLDFDQIKTSIKDYLRSNSNFTDYDFEGSNLSSIIDVLAYNTYITSYNANMISNEVFIDSATLRENVVSLARNIGYVPRSKTSSRANISFFVDTTEFTTRPLTLTLKKGTVCTSSSSFGDQNYTFTIPEDITKPVINGIALFDNVSVYEGTFLVNTFTVNSNNPNQKYILDNSGIDTQSISVLVRNTQSSSVTRKFSLSNSLLDVDSTSRVFFIQEIEDQRYELIFGDGVLGKKLENNTVIEVSYLITSGPASNGVRTFVFSGVLETQDGATPGAFTITINSTIASSGGEEIESTKKIKFNAPKSYGTQDRAVTSQDYAAIIRNIYPSTSDVIIFGGEDQVPPQYGKVFIVLKPNDAAYLTSLTKNQIIEQLKKYVVASVEPVIVDPSILYVELTSKIYYNGSITSDTPSQIRDKVVTNLQNYIEDSDIEKFNGKFRYSKIVGVIDDSDKSINSNITSVTMRKDFYPQLNSTFYYEICYQNAFDKDCEGPTLSTTGFRVTEYPNFDVYLEDRDGKIILYRLDALTGEKVLLDKEVGDIDYVKGELKMYNLTIIKGSFFDNRISVRVKPLSNDVQAFREVYLDVDIPNSSFSAYKE